MFERNYLFNPFLLMTSTDEELSDVINDLAQKYRYTDMPYDIAFNINLESDVLIIYGELVARYQGEIDHIKLEAENTRGENLVKFRDEWKPKKEGEKMPAMSYFEALADKSVYELRQRQNTLHTMLTRFKNHYDSMETKQNALKKKLEAVKFEAI